MNAPDTTSPTYIIDTIRTKFTQDYVVEQPLSLTEPTVAKNINREDELFSIGTSGNIYHTRRDGSVDTGWIQVNTGIAAASICMLNNTTGADSVYFYTPPTNGLASINLLIYNPEDQSYSSKEIVPAHQPVWQFKAYSQSCFFGSSRSGSGTLVIVADLNGDNNWEIYTGPALINNNQNGCVFIVPAKNGSSSPWPGGMVIFNDFEYNQVNLYKLGSAPSDVSESNESLPTGSFELTEVKAYSKMSTVTGIYDGSNNFHLLGTNIKNGTENELYHAIVDSEGKITSETTAPLPSFSLESGVGFFRWAQCLIDGNNELQLVLYNNSSKTASYTGYLYHTSLDLGSDTPTWTEPTNLGIQVSWVYTYTHAYITCYTTTDLNNLLALFFCPPPLGVSLQGDISMINIDEAGDWRETKIEVDPPTNAQVDQINAYRTIVTLFNSVEQIPASGVSVSLKATEETLAQVNGVLTTLSPGVDYPIETTPLGHLDISIHINATDNAFSPGLILTSDEFEGTVEIRPERDVQNYLLTVNTDELNNGADPFNGDTPVIPTDKQQDTSEVAKALNASMQDVNNCFAPQDSLPDFMQKINGQRGVSYYTSTPATCISSSSSKAWKFGKQGDRLKFTYLSDDEFDKLWNEAQVNREQALQNIARKYVDTPEFDFFNDIGDFFESVVNNVADIADDIVGVIVKGVNVLIDIAGEVVSFVLSQVEQFFYLVRTIFDIVGTVLGTVIGWLIKILGLGFFWEQILGIKNDIKSLIQEKAKAAQELDIMQYSSSIESTIQNLEDNFNSIISNINSEIGGNSIQSERGSNTDFNSFIFNFGGHDLFEAGTWITSKLGFVGISSPLSGSPFSSIPNFNTDLNNLLTTLNDGVSSDTLTQITNLLSSWAENVDTFLTGTVETTVSAIQSIVQSLLELVKNAVQLIFQVGQDVLSSFTTIIDWLDDDINIPFFTAFYKAVTGEKSFSILDLICLGVAIPLSIYQAFDSTLQKINYDDSKTTEIIITIFCMTQLREAILNILKMQSTAE
ncbi:MAG: hypothetical protein MI700_03250 [Balneolales bacterium]|nr:hypothetical protein [Balneolales bacterium]